MMKDKIEKYTMNYRQIFLPFLTKTRVDKNLPSSFKCKNCTYWRQNKKYVRLSRNSNIRIGTRESIQWTLGVKLFYRIQLNLLNPTFWCKKVNFSSRGSRHLFGDSTDLSIFVLKDRNVKAAYQS